MEQHLQYLADFVVTVHFAYVAFVVLGLLLTIVGAVCGWPWIRNRWFRGAHLLAILVVVAEAWLGIECPLTTWENQLRAAAGTSTYASGFIAQWLHDVMFFDAPAWVFTLAYTAFGLAVAATWWLVPPRWRGVRSI